MDAMFRRQATKRGVDFRIFEYLDGDRREGGSQEWSPCRNIKSISISVCHLQIIIILGTCFSAPVSLQEGRYGIFSGGITWMLRKLQSLEHFGTEILQVRDMRAGKILYLSVW